MASYPTINPKQKKITPTNTAIERIMVMNLFNSCLRGDSPDSAEEANPAIYPITVLSPVKTTIPFPDPSLHNVPKKAKFLVSKGLSGLVHSGVLKSKSDSPVNDELSTFMS